MPLTPRPRQWRLLTIAALASIGAAIVGGGAGPAFGAEDPSANPLPEMVVATGGMAYEASLAGSLGRPLATGGVAAVAQSRGGSLWVGSNPQPGDEWDAEWGHQWELNSICGYSVMRQPWSAAPLDVAAGPTWTPLWLVSQGERDGPSCDAVATPEGNLAYMRMFVGSGTSTKQLAVDPASGAATVTTLARGCWSLSFAAPARGASCVSRWYAPRGGGYDRVYAGSLTSRRLIDPKSQETFETAIDPTGSRVAYPVGNALWSIASTGGRPRRLTKVPGRKHTFIEKVMWTRDGQALVMKRGQQVWVYRVADGSTTMIMTGIDDFTVPPA